MVRVLNLLQPSNAETPIDATLSVIVSVFVNWVSLKAQLPMVCRVVDAIVRVVTPVQP